MSRCLEGEPGILAGVRVVSSPRMRSRVFSGIAMIAVLSTASTPRGAGAAGILPLTPDASFVGGSHDEAAMFLCGPLDLDGDGFDDLVIAAADGARVFFGHPGGYALDENVSYADVELIADGPSAGTHLRPAALGDVNGDGFDDLGLGMTTTISYPGQVALVLGRPSGWPVQLPMASADASFVGEVNGDMVGWAVAGGGDVNGDGLADLLIGAKENGESANDAGQAYLVLGHVDGWMPGLPLSAVDASFQGETDYDSAGETVGIAGDLDGDGLDDLVVAAPGSGEVAQAAGQVYILFGRPAGWMMDTTLANADASWLGEREGACVGRALSGAGDVDGDGLDDLLIGAPLDDEAGNMAGQVYLVLGSTSGWAMDMSLTNADASWLGETEHDYLGYAVAGAGDANGDGLADIVVGAPQYNQALGEPGQVYVILGRASGWAVDTTVAMADGFFVGELPGAELGTAVAGVGDVDGDAYDDVLGGAPYDSEYLAQAGQGYLFQGFPDEDQDGDGYTTWGGDCDDTDPAINPGVTEQADGVDEDCNGIVDDGTEVYDDDGDGFAEVDGDCDDADADLFPGAPEYCDGVDSDCDGQPGPGENDGDGDGFLACEECDDTDPAVYPGAPESCDGVDSDCEGDLSETEQDDDGDGFAECDGDCDDVDAAVHPDAVELCNGGIDDDCDQVTDETTDGDGDGFAVCDGDCDDGDAAVHPDAAETCDGVDRDCNGIADDLDDDGDGSSPCDDAPDCDDGDAAVHPGAPEQPYDGVDSDCDGLDPDDLDGDGFAGGATGDDCDDEDDGTYPGAEETPYDGVDQDCDGRDLTDLDGDGYEATDLGTDCNDTDPAVHPLADEDCEDGQDNNCDGLTDAQDPDCEPDGDGDGGCACRLHPGVQGPGTAGLLLAWLAIHAGRRRGDG